MTAVGLDIKYAISNTDYYDDALRTPLSIIVGLILQYNHPQVGRIKISFVRQINDFILF